jgi:hypothetical protein
MLVYAAPNQTLNQRHELVSNTRLPAQAQVSELAGVNELRYWVFVELYLAAAGNDLRTAIVNAHAANTQPGTVFVLPGGDWPWVGGTFAPRNRTTWLGYGCNIIRDVGGLATGQIIFFLRSDTGVTHADQINFIGIGFYLLNALTSFFGYAVGLEAASNCTIKDCAAICTLVPGATQGRTRWGFNLFGGDRVADPTCGLNNRYENTTLRFAQIAGCGAGRSANGVTIINTICYDANDLAISVVSTGADKTLENVSIINTLCHNVGGSGVVFAGTDGSGTGIGIGVVRNILIDGVYLEGSRSTPDLDFPFICDVIFNGGLVTENVTVTNCGSRLVPNASLNTRSILIASQEDEVQWDGLTVSDCNLGVISSNDPLEGLFIQGTNIRRVNITNVGVRGLRGFRIVNCSSLVMTNCNTQDGRCTVLATRDIDGVQINNCNFTQTTGFNNALAFTSSNGSDFSKVQLSSLILNSGLPGLNVSLNGGTMQMWLDDIENTSNSNLSAQTLAGIIRYKSCRGFTALVTLLVTVPAVPAGEIRYVDVPMAGTRLADMFVGDPLVVNPAADLEASGPGGGLLYSRVSATGTARLCFVGPLTGGDFNFNFDRAN